MIDQLIGRLVSYEFLSQTFHTGSLPTRAAQLTGFLQRRWQIRLHLDQ